MSNYSKLIAAVVGLVSMIVGPAFLGLTTAELDAATITQGIIGLLTALGVYGFRNTPPAIADMPRKQGGYSTLPMLAALLVISFGLAGCANLANGIGAAALSIDTIADSVADECANPTPQQGCVSTSLITTAQAREVKKALQEGQDAVVDANAALNAGNKAEAGNKLGIAQAIIASVKATLNRRGVTTE